MPRTKRYTPGGLVYHVLMPLLEEDTDYRAFLRVVGETFRLAPMRICGYCVMVSH